MDGTPIETKDEDYMEPYFNNDLVAFDQGCVTDFRFRLAVELLQSRLFSASVDKMSPSTIVGMALQLSEELVSEGEKRGYVSPVPDNGRLSEALKQQAERVAKYQVHQQIAGQRHAQQEAGLVASPAMGIMRGN